MLSNAGLWDPKAFWDEAVSIAFSLVNRSPHASSNFQIRKEVWSGRAVDYSMILCLPM